MCRHDSATILIPDISARACACARARSHSGAASPAAAGTNQPQPSASQFASMQRESFLSCDSLNPASTRRPLTLSSRHCQTRSDLLKYFGRLQTAQPGRKVSLSLLGCLSSKLRHTNASATVVAPRQAAAPFSQLRRDGSRLVSQSSTCGCAER